jgi:hypothetical protein
VPRAQKADELTRQGELLVKWLLVFLFSLNSYVLAQETDPSKIEEKGQLRPMLDSSTAVRIRFHLPTRNKSSAAIDTASILMREGETGRTIQLLLVETEPDSSIFSGFYQINFQNIQRLQVEFYSPPQNQINDMKSMKGLIEQIETKQIRRNPYILRRSSGGQQTIEIFETPEKARAAIRSYRREQQTEALQNQQLSKIASEQATEKAQLAALLATELAAKAAAAKAAAELDRLKQLEAKRLEELRARQAAANEAERRTRLDRALKLSEKGLELFRAGDFLQARNAFDQAVSLDPANRVFYFQYAVTLYKTDDFSRSLVFLGMANDAKVSPSERMYYIGLNNFRLKEYEPSLRAFQSVIAGNDPSLTPSAHFYKGIIQYENRRWEEAQQSFQAVLDTSDDPRLDERAEAYIEMILKIKHFEEEAKQKWALSTTLGEIVDSNVILASDSQRDAGLATNVEGLRSLLSGSIRYRPIYEETREFAAQLDLMTMYTLDKSLKIDSTLRTADPTTATLTLPWTYKGFLWGKGYKLDLTPGYETIYMGVEDDQQKEILNSFLFNISNLLMMSDSWFATYNLELRSDNSKLSSSTGDDDSSATKIKLLNSHMIFLDSDKTRILTAEGALTTNQAKGKNTTYNRIDLALGYIAPLNDEWTANGKLGFYQLGYPSNPNERADSNTTLTGGASRKIGEMWNLGATGTYTLNSSNVETNSYKKWTLLLTLSGSWGF